MNWAIGIQTCPRPEDVYIDHTIESVKRAGWDDITIFAEPDSPVPQGYPVTYRPFRYGDWTNWVCAYFELFMANPEANAFVLFEDDVTSSRNIRSYLEWAIPKLGRFGCLSLYTPPKHHSDFQGWHDEADTGWALSGAQAMVFTRGSLQRFLSDPKVVNYRFDEIGKKNAHKDCAIGKWACKKERVLYHNPSLIDHRGVESLIGTKNHRARDYVGDEFDCVELIGQINVLPAKSEIF